MTQSGMGCPDWPRCFGMWIPPVSESQLPADFEKYLSKQDIDHSFNVYHTWIEYINRLLGAVLGLFILFNFGWAVKSFRKTNAKVVVLSFILVLLVGFQGWLGKLVVDSNLSVVKITIHMLVAILIAAIPLLNIAALKTDPVAVPSKIRKVYVVMIVLALIQIVMGTQVREQIDIISKSLSYGQREVWISMLDGMFLIHRSFSWLLLIGGIYLWQQLRRSNTANVFGVAAISVILFTIVLGVVMAYLGIPALAQPLHLVAACVLVMVLIYGLVRTCSEAKVGSSY